MQRRGIRRRAIAVAAGTLLFAHRPLVGSEERPEVIAWATSTGDRYLLREDSCYERYRRFLAPDTVRFFTAAAGAEGAGFQRKPVGLVPLEKYADVCSPLYEYALSSTCEKVFFDDPTRGGFVPIERFESNLTKAKVVGIVRSKTYLTPCDEDYRCFTDTKKDRSPACQRMVESTGLVKVLPSESRARAEGYVSVAESYFSELGEGF